MKLPVYLPLALLAGVLSAASAEPAAPPRPNVILVLLDDMGYSDPGFMGGEIQTPTMDRLAATGQMFTQFYNASKCEPTRTALLSGVYWQKAGLGIQRGITLGDSLRSAGYRTLAIGKWHVNGNPVDRGFDRWFGIPGGASSYFAPRELLLGHETWTPPKEGRFYVTDAFTDFAIQFIDEAVTEDPRRPFFLYLAYNAPHSPLQALPEDVAKYKGRFDAGWDALRVGRFDRMKERGILADNAVLPPRPDHIPSWESLPPQLRADEAARMEVYAAMIDRVDQGLARITADLERLGIADNTLILILSDNGASPFGRHAPQPVSKPDTNTAGETGVGWAWLSNTPYRWYKRNQHQGGIATAFVAHWPKGIATPGTIVREPAHIIDIMPTLNALAGVDYAATFEGKPSPDYGEPYRRRGAWDTWPPGGPVPPLTGRDLAACFAGKTPPPPDAYYFGMMNHRGLLRPPWKLVSIAKAPWELYNLADDPTELNDLAKSRPDEAARLEREWGAWFESTGLPADLMRGTSLPNTIRGLAYREINTGRIYKGDGQWGEPEENRQKGGDDE